MVRASRTLSSTMSTAGGCGRLDAAALAAASGLAALGVTAVRSRSAAPGSEAPAAGGTGAGVDSAPGAAGEGNGGEAMAVAGRGGADAWAGAGTVTGGGERRTARTGSGSVMARGAAAGSAGPPGPASPMPATWVRSRMVMYRRLERLLRLLSPYRLGVARGATVCGNSADRSADVSECRNRSKRISQPGTGLPTGGPSGRHRAPAAPPRTIERCRRWLPTPRASSAC